MSARRVRIEVDGRPEWGRLAGDEIVLDSGWPVAEATYLAPAEPTKIVAVHLTYRSRIEEYRARTPVEPSYFLKPPTTLNGHRGTIAKPAGSRFLNYEGEVAAVIGRRMKGVPMEETLAYVAGFCCANDVGLHDFRHADRGSMLRVKGQDGFLPSVPSWCRPRSGIPPPTRCARTSTARSSRRRRPTTSSGRSSTSWQTSAA